MLEVFSTEENFLKAVVDQHKEKENWGFIPSGKGRSFIKLNKTRIHLQKIHLGMSEEALLCDSKDNLLGVFDILFIKMLLKIKFI